MSDVAKKILHEMNKPLSERLKDQFAKYLEDIDQAKLIEVAKRIDWNPVVQLFELEYKRLWNNMAVPKSIKELKELNNEFANLVMASIRQRLFYSTYSYLKSLTDENRLNHENINSLMSDMFSAGMYDLFRVFDFQNGILSDALGHRGKGERQDEQDLQDISPPEQSPSDPILSSRVFLRALVVPPLGRCNQTGHRVHADGNVGVTPGP